MGHWFKHDSDASADKKLRTLKKRLGYEGIGIWWSFVECLASEKNQKISKTCIEGIEDILGIDSEKLNLFLDTCYSIKDEEGTPLLCSDENNIWSQSLINRQKAYEEEKERNRLAKQKTRAGQSKDISGTSEGQKADASISYSYSSSSSNSESNNKNSEFVEVMHGRQCLEGNVWLSEEETELAKMRLSQNGLEHSDFEEAVRTLSDYLRGENNRFPKDKHYALLVGKININSLLANKRQKDLNKRTNDPPRNFKQKTGEEKFQDRAREIFNL